jgi:hypothetical protein
LLVAIVASFGFVLPAPAQSQSSPPPDLWKLANQAAPTHRFSVLFTAYDMRGALSYDAGLRAAIDWCKQTGVTKVYLEVFRDGNQVEQAILEKAKQTFRSAGFEVSGCVTPTRVGKASSGWKEVACCYSDQPTQDKLQAIFEYAAGLFDEIMIDDFWFTDCACPACDAARRAKTVAIGKQTYPVDGDSWEAFRSELMVRLSRDRLLGSAKRVNPNARLIIKYPQWYDDFQERGYEVVRESADFDRIWVGTETRDYQGGSREGAPPYAGYFIMRWLGGLGGAKCGGGWYDSISTTERTYIEQARQTVLGGAQESMLFSYGDLRRGLGQKDVAVLRTNLPELLTVAREVRSRPIIGVAAYKPPNSQPAHEARVFDFVGMMGLPLVPCHEFPTNAPAAFFSVHALKDADFAVKLGAFIEAGKPVLLTDGLAGRLGRRVKLDAANVRILPVKQNPESLLQLGQMQLDELRAQLLVPLKTSFRAPNRVALYLLADGSWVVENFNATDAPVELNNEKLTVPPRGWVYRWK